MFTNYYEGEVDKSEEEIDLTCTDSAIIFIASRIEKSNMRLVELLKHDFEDYDSFTY